MSCNQLQCRDCFINNFTEIEDIYNAVCFHCLKKISDDVVISTIGNEKMDILTKNGKNFDILKILCFKLDRLATWNSGLKFTCKKNFNYFSCEIKAGVLAKLLEYEMLTKTIAAKIFFILLFNKIFTQ